MQKINCSTFADQVIEGMGWPEVFRDSPLLRTTLELGVAWGYEKFLRGDYGADVSPTMFAVHVESVVDNELIGRIDLLPDAVVAVHRDFPQVFRDAVAAAFAALKETADEPAQGTASAAEASDGGKLAGGSSTGRNKAKRVQARKSAKSLRRAKPKTKE